MVSKKLYPGTVVSMAADNEGEPKSIARYKVFIGFENRYNSGRKLQPKANGSTGKVEGYIISNLTLFTRKWVKGLELTTGAYAARR